MAGSVRAADRPSLAARFMASYGERTFHIVIEININLAPAFAAL